MTDSRKALSATLLCGPESQGPLRSRTCQSDSYKADARQDILAYDRLLAHTGHCRVGTPMTAPGRWLPIRILPVKVFFQYVPDL